MKTSKSLKIAATALMALAAAFFMFMVVGEMLGGDLSGMIHLPPVALIVLMMWFGWKKPLTGGITMALLGLVIGVYFFSLAPKSEMRMAGVLIMSMPFLLPGLMFITASMLEHRNPTQHV